MHKCSVMLFGARNRRIDYALDGVNVTQVSLMRDPGVTFSNELDFGSHVSGDIRRVSLVSSWTLCESCVASLACRATWKTQKGAGRIPVEGGIPMWFTET